MLFVISRLGRMLLFAINTSTSRIISERRGKDRDRLIKICCMCRAEQTAIQCAACCRCVGQSEIGALGDAAVVVTATRSNKEKFGDVSFLSNRIFPSSMATYNTYRHPPTPTDTRRHLPTPADTRRHPPALPASCCFEV